MCNPLIAAVALAAVSTGVGIVAQNQAASASNKALTAQNELRKQQVDQAATAEINDRLREKRREQGRIMVAAGEVGLSLNSGGVESLLMDSTMQSELANQRSLANRESRKAASDAETNSKYQAKTTALGAGLQIGLSSASAYYGSKAKANK